MSVYQKKGSPYWHFDFIVQGRRFYGSTGAKTKREALKVEAAKRVQAVTGELLRAAVPTLDEAANTWWEAKGRDLKSAATWEARLDVAVKLIGANVPVNEVDADTLRKAIAKRRAQPTKHGKPRSNTTINRDIVEVIRPVIRMAREDLNSRVGQGVPFPDIKWRSLTLAEPKPVPREHTRQDINRVIEALPEHWHDFARFAATYGCRLSEMFFKPEALNLSTRRLTLRDRKNDSDHVLPLLPADFAMLAARVTRAKAAKLDTVWYRETQAGLKPLTYNAAKWAMRRAFKAVGVGKGAHDFRHFAAMDTLKRSGNIRLAQRLLGHSNIASTMVYAHVLDDDILEALESRAIPEAPKREPRKPLQDKAERDNLAGT